MGIVLLSDTDYLFVACEEPQRIELKERAFVVGTSGVESKEHGVA